MADDSTQDSALSSRSSTGSSVSWATSSTLGTANTLLHSLARPERKSWWAMLVAGLVAIALTLPFASSPLMLRVGAVGVGLLGISLAGAYWIHRHPAVQAPTRIALACFAAASSTLILLFYGLIGPTIGFVTIGLLLFSIQSPPKTAALVACIVGIPHSLTHFLMWLRVLEPRGMVVPHGDYPGETASIAAAPFLYILAVALGQIFRRQTIRDMERLAEAGREVAAREVLLREARRELEEAAGVGQPGRFTGQRLGSFELDTILGRGGMGEIYRAAHSETGEPAAVKLLRPLVGDPSGVLERFARESSILQKLDSPFLVRVLEVGGMEAELPYIAMELLEGADLGSILRNKKKLSPTKTAELVSQVARGLAETARHKIVHRDIKPNNLFRTTAGQWKVLDFGVARLAGSSNTLTGTKLVGTPAYMAPEQVSENAHVDHRTDIYALSIVAYRALTGHPAYSGKDLGLLLQKITDELPRRPSALAGVGPEVDDVLRIGMEKDPAQRFQNVTELADALQGAIRGKQDPAIAGQAESLNAKLSWKAEEEPK